MGRYALVTDEQIIPLLKEGLNHREISEKLQVSRTCVTRAIKRLDPETILDYSMDTFEKNEAKMSAKARMLIMNLLIGGLQSKRPDDMTINQLKQLASIAQKLWQQEQINSGLPTELIGHGHRFDPEQIEDLKKIARELSQSIIHNSVKPLIEYTGGDSEEKE
jgi:transposase